MKPKKLVLILPLLLMFSFLFILGCSDRLNQPENTRDELLESNTFYSCGLHLEGKVIRKYVKADHGGKIKIEVSDETKHGLFPTDFEVTLKILKGALPADTLISVQAIRKCTDQGQVLGFRFGPKGIEFAKDLILKIDIDAYEDGSAPLIRWEYFNPVTQNWEYQFDIKPNADKVEIPISHFSRYRSYSQGGQ